MSISTTLRAATMLKPTCSARSAGRCLVRWHSFTHFTTGTATSTQRSTGIHTTTRAHAQQKQQEKQQAKPQPSSERKFRGKRRSRRRKGHEASDDDAFIRSDNANHDRNSSAGTEKATVFRRIIIEKETYSASNLSTSWTTPSVLPSQHPALQAVLEGVFSQQKSSKGSLQQKSSNRSVQAWVHQLDEGEDEGHDQERDTEKAYLSTFGADEVVSSATDKEKAFSEEVASNNMAVSNTIDSDEAPEHAGANVEVVSISTDNSKDKAFSEEVAGNNEAVSTFIDNEKNSETPAVANVEVVSGIADRRKRDWKPSIEVRLQDKPYLYYANVKVVPSITENNDASSEVGANEDEMVSSSTNSEAAGRKSKFAVEMNGAVDIKLQIKSSSPIEVVKSDSPDDDKYILYSHAPSKSSSNTSKRKAAWFLPSTTSSPSNKNSSVGSEEEEEIDQKSNLNP